MLVSVKSAASNCPQPLACEGVHARPEESPHLLGGDSVPGVQAIDADHAGTDPRSGAFSAFGVIGVEPDMTLIGGIQGRDLPGQVVVPRPGAELVDAHRHNHQKAIRAN
jgi:hypothetical protein